mmetsp:Transcript_4227/g.8227  ORF Transcript_4227/g.8227 Transcript_4227/m.8227 type:complete len:343 (-) Transcript_4227:168-1196(-)
MEIAETLPGAIYRGPNIYGPHQTPFELDYSVAAVVACFVAFLVTSVLTLDVKSFRRFLRWLTLVFLAALFFIIVLAIYTRSWHTAEVDVVVSYAPYDSREVSATVGLHIGLAGINVTLKGLPEEQIGQTINYNEEFDWATPGRDAFYQGRIGFGRFANLLNQAFHRSQFRGAPLAIQAVAEYFTFDGDGIRWGRYYRLAGYYTFILLWLAMGFFILSLLFGVFRLKLGVLFLWCCGVTMISSCILYTILIKAMPLGLQIPFQDASGQIVVLAPTYGWSYWLTLITGTVVVAISIVTWFFNTAAEVSRKIDDDEMDMARGIEKIVYHCVSKDLANRIRTSIEY